MLCLIILGLDIQGHSYYLNLDHFSCWPEPHPKTQLYNCCYLQAAVANNWTSEGEGGIFKVKKRLYGFHFNLSTLFLITGNYKLALVQRQTEILNSCSLYKIHNSSPASLGFFSLAQWMCAKQSWNLSWKTHGLRGSIEKCCVGKQSSLFAALQMIGFHFIRCFHCLLKASADAKQCGPAIPV